MKRLVLIDGHAILHRAYHALPPTLTNKKGQQTNAVYGFMTMLLKVLADLAPTHLIVAFDLPQATFRMQAYTAYQSRRPDMESSLKDQVQLVHELLVALEIPYFEVGGYEADDCIGTLAKRGAEAGLEVFIVTGDRDMLQLVSDKVKVYVPIKGLTETKTYDQVAVEEEFGVKPGQWVDVKALKGDASDNYPGVPGIGPKTACELIAKYGTLEEIFAKLDHLVKTGEIKESTGKLLAEGAESAGLGKQLATIVTNVPLSVDFDKAQVSEIKWREGVTFMKEKLGFKTIVERIEKSFLNGGQMSLIE